MHRIGVEAGARHQPVVNDMDQVDYRRMIYGSTQTRAKYPRALVKRYPHGRRPKALTGVV